MQPVYVDIMTPDQQRVSTVCKFPTRGNRAPAESVINEWIGCFSAKLIGLQAPECFIVDASPHVQLHLVEKHGVNVSSQFGFASRVSQIDSIIYPSTLARMDPEDLTRLFCFDVLFINADRIPNNPNCGHAQKRLFTFDFGSALVSPGTSPNSFDKFFFGPALNDRVSAHLCREFVLSPELAESVINDIIDRLAASRWYASLRAGFLPQALPDHLSLVVRYIDYICKERNMICHQIVNTI